MSVWNLNIHYLTVSICVLTVVGLLVSSGSDIGFWYLTWFRGVDC
jgi:hypothetical protein